MVLHGAIVTEQGVTLHDGLDHSTSLSPPVRGQGGRPRPDGAPRARGRGLKGVSPSRNYAPGGWVGRATPRTIAVPSARLPVLRQAQDERALGDEAALGVESGARLAVLRQAQGRLSAHPVRCMKRGFEAKP